MAPNRKSSSSLVQTIHDLEGLQQTVQAKYLPLTDPQEASQQQQSEPSATATDNTQDSSVSYWNWAATDINEPTVCLFSADNIVSNLVQASSSMRSSEANTTTLPQNDAYWAEQSQSSPLESSVSDAAN